ncbi:hypothetical protein FJ364_02420 [Candidatus Dependentiae bacterium]|nr:hypothetical protein [Candidatus Dependentiae bacterium]
MINCKFFIKNLLVIFFISVMRIAFFDSTYAMPSVDSGDDGEQEVPAVVLTEEEIENLRNECAAVQREVAGIAEEVEGIREQVCEPVFIHRVVNRRESYLEAVENFNKRSIYTFNNLQAPVINHRAFFNEDQELFEARPVCIQMRDALSLLFYNCNLICDAKSLGGFFDELIEAITQAIINKKSTVLYNLKQFATSNHQELKEAALVNLHESLRKALSEGNAHYSRAFHYFQRQSPTVLINYLEKISTMAPFIWKREPRPGRDELRDFIEPDREGADVAVPLTESIYSKFIVFPLLASLRAPYEDLINQQVTGYSFNNEGYEPKKLLTNFLSTLVLNAGTYGGSSFLDVLLEAAKQGGYAEPFDETLWFTAGMEVLFNTWFFYRTLDKAVQESFQKMFTTDLATFSEVIELFEAKMLREQEMSMEQQVVHRERFKSEISELVKKHFAPLQPALLMQLRSNKVRFKAMVTFLLLTPSLYKLVMNVGGVVKKVVFPE